MRELMAEVETFLCGRVTRVGPPLGLKISVRALVSGKTKSRRANARANFSVLASRRSPSSVALVSDFGEIGLKAHPPSQLLLRLLLQQISFYSHSAFTIRFNPMEILTATL